MLPAFLITLREGLEAALIVSILAAYLSRTGRRAELRTLAIGVGAAAVASLVVGVVVSAGVAVLSDRAHEAFEACAGVVATGVLTWMVFWMRRQARSIR